jgi:hypothetical protein
MSPEGPNLVLPTDVPYGELDVLVLNGLDVEACGNMSDVKHGWRRVFARTDGRNCGAIERQRRI